MAPHEREDWVRKAEGLVPRSQAFIDGEYVDAATGETFPCVSPIDGRVITHVAACDSTDVDRAVRAARAAFEDGRWAERSPQDRRRTLLAFVAQLHEHREELALLETLDAGKPITDTLEGDIPIAADDLQYFAEAIDKLYGEVAPTDPSVFALVTREPIGVVGAVVPWNFPLSMAMWKIAPALATGNSVVLKPAEQSPLSALRIAELAANSGVPDGVLNVVPGHGEAAGQALGRHMDVDAIAFTGSTEVGKLFLRYAGESNMKAVSLECGGKNPQVVMPDCGDLDVAAQRIARGSFFNQGQVCNSASRLLVHADIRDELVDRLLALADTWEPSDPFDPTSIAGAVIDETHLRRILDYVSVGISEGANLRAGGTRTRESTRGFYIRPTIFDEVIGSMRIAQEEIFGPVLSVLSFRSTDEAIALANDTRYGLAATVWTKDLDSAFRLARRIRAGVVCVNSYAFGWSMVPFGGFKQSGFGRDQSLHAFDKYTQLKTTWIDVGR